MIKEEDKYLDLQFNSRNNTYLKICKIEELIRMQYINKRCVSSIINFNDSIPIIYVEYNKKLKINSHGIACITLKKIKVSDNEIKLYWRLDSFINETKCIIL